MKISALLPLVIMLLPLQLGASPALTPESAKPLVVGSAAPAAMVQTSDGTMLDLGAVVRKQPTVLIFYRGGWCPYCNTHLAELQNIEPELLALGFQIVAVSPDRPGSMPATTDKHQLSYELFSDRAMHAASAYGIAFLVPADVRVKYEKWNFDLAPVPGDDSQRWLPVPAVFLIGRDGTVLFSHSDPNYKQRVDLQELLAAAKAMHLTAPTSPGIPGAGR